MEQIFINTLLYSLGSGLVLAILTGLTLFLTRNSSPLLRYRTLVFFLALFALSTVAIIVAQTGSTASREKAEVVSVSVVPQYNTQISATPGTQGMISMVTGFMMDHSRTILLLWLMIVIAKTTMLASNLLELHHLKTKKIFPAGAYWEERVSRLSEQIGLNKTVRIVQSGIIQVPVVIGHFKPVILVPLGMITAIKPEQIEMMLLHELAHIKRMDFIVNFLQHVLELLFFFNPAVLWTSSLIRKERENCCDDMVLQNAPSKHNYIQALLSFKEYQLNVPAYAMAFAKESSLVSRVKRIVYQKNSSLNSIEKVLLLFAVILLCSFSVFNSTTSADKVIAKFQQPKPKTKTAAPIAPARKTVPLKKEVTDKALIDKDQLREEIREDIKNDAEAREILSDKAIDHLADAATNFSSRLSDLVINLVVPTVTNTLNSTLDLSIDNSLSALDPLQDTIRKIKVRPNTDVKTKVNATPKIRDESRDVKVTKNASEVKPRVYAAPKLNAESKINARSEIKVESKVAIKPQNEGLTEKMIAALQKAGIDTKGEEFSFMITNTELTVNGVKQPDNVHKQVVDGFLKSPEDKIEFTYNRKGGSVNSSSNYHTK